MPYLPVNILQASESSTLQASLLWHLSTVNHSYWQWSTLPTLSSLVYTKKYQNWKIAMGGHQINSQIVCSKKRENDEETGERKNNDPTGHRQHHWRTINNKEKQILMVALCHFSLRSITSAQVGRFSIDLARWNIS